MRIRFCAYFGKNWSEVVYTFLRTSNSVRLYFEANYGPSLFDKTVFIALRSQTTVPLSLPSAKDVAYAS